MLIKAAQFICYTFLIRDIFLENACNLLLLFWGISIAESIDINTPEFKGNLDSFIRRKADFENCNAKTMKALKQAAGITPEKVRKDKNLER